MTISLALFGFVCDACLSGCALLALRNCQKVLGRLGGVALDIMEALYTP
jgi:hypothetical protein